MSTPRPRPIDRSIIPGAAAPILIHGEGGRREYQFCTKGGHEKESDTHWVCERHQRQGGPHTHCAVCGDPMAEPVGLDYVHGRCLAENTFDPERAALVAW